MEEYEMYLGAFGISAKAKGDFILTFTRWRTKRVSLADQMD